MNRNPIRWFLDRFALVLVFFGPPRGVMAEARPPRIECEVTLPCPAEEAWKAWTTEQGLESFLARSAKVTPEEGGVYQVVLGGAELEDPQSSKIPRVLRAEAPRDLSFEWIIPLPQAAARESLTVVTIHIEPVSSRRCRIRLDHTGWAVGEQRGEAFAYSERFWKATLQNLRATLNARRRPEHGTG